jgi:general stress protein 26
MEQAEIQEKFWDAIRRHPTLMLGLAAEGGTSRPMTACFEEGSHSMWFFSSRQTELVRRLNGAQAAVVTYVGKGHDFWATLAGTLSLDMDRQRIDRFWNRFIAAWFEGGKEDPNLALLRFDTQNAEIWLAETSLLEGVKLLLGADPKKEYADHVAKVSVR